MSARASIVPLSLLLCGRAWAGDSALEPMARGDEAYERRAEGHTESHGGIWAAPGPISEAIDAFEEAVAANPGDPLARTKLMRALFFKGDYVVREAGVKLELFERGQMLGEDGITRLLEGTDLDRRGGKDRTDLVRHLRDQPHAAGIYYWSAVHWGVWGRHTGKIKAARQGVAGKVRDYAEIANEIAAGYEDGGVHRMLGRLHAEAPKIPLVTGWIDRKRAISELEIARSFSEDPLTLLYWIEALLDYDPSRREEALDLLRSLVTSEPGTDYLVEDKRALSEARTLLNSLSD